MKSARYRLICSPNLLRVLEEGKVYPLGDNKPRRVDFRLLAATNKDLRTETAAGRFRLDLFYRVSVGLLRIPPLRERKDDIPFLVEHFNSQVAERHGRPMKEFQPEVLAVFREYSWPGNIRELRNIVETLVVLNGQKKHRRHGRSFRRSSYPRSRRVSR